MEQDYKEYDRYQRAKNKLRKLKVSTGTWFLIWQ